MQNDVKVEITCANGRVEAVESHAVYGCAVTEIEEEKGHGVACKSFFTGHVNPVLMGARWEPASHLLQRKCVMAILYLSESFWNRQWESLTED